MIREIKSASEINALIFRKIGEFSKPTTAWSSPVLRRKIPQADGCNWYVEVVRGGPSDVPGHAECAYTFLDQAIAHLQGSFNLPASD